MKMLRTITPTAWVGLFIISVNIVLFAAGPHIAPFGQEEIVGSPFDPPSAMHWFGLDQNGRDMLSRLLAGAQISIGVSLAASLLSFTIGITLGFIAAIFGGWLDMVLSRIVDTIMCIPVLISALVVLQALGSSIPVLIVTIALLDSTRVFRLARIVAQGVNVLEYAETARLRGEGLIWLVFREILPNALPPLIAEFGLRFCFTFLFVAGLSFLGLGVQPPFADWGGMVKDNQQAILYGLYAPLYPAAAIAVLTIGVNLVVDWLLAGRSAIQGADR
ncbi:MULTISPECIES: ABC transporter permease [Rhizobium/Agrobacterium group]|jgi:peptide/nickel transport system permease protein|uniref:ABC transporter permease n=1 Tax=Rhizobium rhizogenes TaxID=359 RepID=A0AA94VA49_RHIRH|nr:MULTISPECIES: ABC transporter permease [Rhizobium/Agrobacterium group]MDX8326265.1 ABC transporter permease [Agrobacterium tumefaciens]NSZ85372.1 ABC transporter permease [Agrobacterium tumefaciens]NTA17231.1 ABC transporter permease [Agrobacterium tumefaciens]QTQ84116.1 ABC transporter permease [Agrobacterium tumefaciens]TRA85966.1 ABC transporter permease [Rhizobium rhizogenes]